MPITNGSSTHGTSTELTRRGFVKGAAVAAGAFGLAGAGGMLSTGDWLTQAHGAEEPEEHYGYVRHQFHCLTECCLKVTVRDGRLVMIEPNDALEPDDRHICLRGINEIQHVYAADRIQTPLKRVGERGEGKFEQISWDEAIKTIADAIKASQEQYGEGSFFCRKSTEASIAQGFEYIVQLLHGDQGGRWGLDRGQANGWDPGCGSYSWLPHNRMSEFKDASTVILLGNNILESGLVWSKAIFDAKDNGTYFVGIDPRFSPTCSKCDQYVPVKPGTDAALLMAMVKVIMDNEWYDAQYMQSYTGFGFLVDEKTGEVLKKTVKVKDGQTNEETEVETPLVWDAQTGSALCHNEEGVVPTLEGTFTVNGTKAITVFSMLQEQYADCTTDWACGICGIDQQTITDLANRYANNGPAMIAFGLGGPDKFTNADVLGHVLMVLTAMTGNWAKTGAGTSWYGAGGATSAASSLQSWTLPEEFGYGDTGLSLYDYPYTEDCPIHCALTFGDVFTLESGNANAMLDWVKTLDFFAIVDIYHSSIVDYADIVLPACTKFECEEPVHAVRSGKDYLSLSTKCIDPLFESKTDLQIERLLAAQWGLEQYIPTSYEELARTMLADPTGNMEGFTYDALMDHQGVLRFLDADEEKQATNEFGTASGKWEPYYESQVEVGQALPTYETPDESFEANPLHDTYPLAFLQGKTRFRIHAYYSASAWFQEYYGPSVNISPADAAARGIQTNDDVRVYNDRGEFVARALVNNSIQPGTLFMAETTYNHYYKSGFLQNVTNSARQERCYAMKYGPQIPYNDTLVEIEKA